MPELPEVETIRSGLQATIRGRQITAVQVLWPPVCDVPLPLLTARLVGARVAGVQRRGKVLIVDLDHEAGHLLIHPRMTGQLVVCRRRRTLFAGGHPSAALFGPMPTSMTRLIIEMTAATTLYFNDQRTFGRVWLAPSAGLEADPFLSRLGPEPLSRDFTVAVLRERLGRHRRASIKAALLDQRTVAGLGNIYTDECLHRAGIHPARTTETLGHPEIARLYSAIIATLHAAVEDGGTSFADSVNRARGHRTFLADGRVFHRQGQPRPTCGTVIDRVRVAGRGTNYCPHCQPELLATGTRRH